MVHSTVAIEGSPVTFEETKQILEKGGPITGRTALECQEVLGIYAGFNLMCELLKEGSSKKISLKDILDLHSHVLSGTDLKPSRLYSIPVLRNIFKPQKIAGVLRKQQVYIGRNNFIPANHKLVPAKMDDFITWFNNCHSSNAATAVEIAALAHYKLVMLHPFVDGNGRMSRLLMNFKLLQAGFPPVVIPQNESREYCKCLQVAEEGGDIRPFIRYIIRKTDHTLKTILESDSTK